MGSPPVQNLTNLQNFHCVYLKLFCSAVVRHCCHFLFLSLSLFSLSLSYSLPLSLSFCFTLSLSFCFTLSLSVSASLSLSILLIKFILSCLPSATSRWIMFHPHIWNRTVIHQYTHTPGMRAIPGSVRFSTGEAETNSNHSNGPFIPEKC